MYKKKNYFISLVFFRTSIDKFLTRFELKQPKPFPKSRLHINGTDFVTKQFHGKRILVNMKKINFKKITKLSYYNRTPKFITSQEPLKIPTSLVHTRVFSYKPT